MAEPTPPPQPATDQPLFSTDSDGKRTMSVNGKVYDVLDIGYINGNPYTACIILSEDSVVISPIADATAVCAACWHPEPVPLVPDWITCGVPVGGHGALIKFKKPWECHCLLMMKYESIDTSTIDETLTFPAMCGAPKVAPPSAALAAAAVAASLLALGAFAFFTQINQGVAGYSGDVPPGFDPSINMGEDTGNGTPAKKCPDPPAGGVSRTKATDKESDCK
jgi:hypothetical protein